MRNREPYERMSSALGRAVLPIALALAVGSPSAGAGEGEWTLKIEPTYVEAHGHDQHVLTIREIDLDATPQMDNKRAANLDTDGGFAYRGEFQYTKKEWGWGVDVFWFATSQSAPNRTAAADGPGGTIDEVVFEIADRTFSSTDPSEVLYYNLLEDTDLAIWTLDFYGIRTLAAKPESDIQLQFGLRFGDFDNDYRAAAGVQGVGGSRLDASSNYDRMQGPLVGLAGDVRKGKHRIEGYLGQSVLLGSVLLTSMSREFTGPFSENPAYFAQEGLSSDQDVAIPVTEFRLKWSYQLRPKIALGVGTHTSAWWDVPVPPGVIPIEGGDGVFHENTIVFFGVSGLVEIRF